MTRKFVEGLLNGEWFRLADFPGKANPMKVLVYAKVTTIAKLQALLGEKGYIEVDQLTLPEGFMIPKLFEHVAHEWQGARLVQPTVVRQDPLHSHKYRHITAVNNDIWP